MTKVEEVALAIVNHESRKLDLPELATVDEFRFDSDRAHYMEIARAAILAMREPSEGMREAGRNVEPLHSDVADIYRAMNDVALAE